MMKWIQRHYNEKGLCTHIAIHDMINGKIIYEAFIDYDEEGNLIKTTSTKDIWYDYYHEDDYYERSRMFDRNRRY